MFKILKMFWTTGYLQDHRLQYLAVYAHLLSSCLGVLHCPPFFPVPNWQLHSVKLQPFEKETSVAVWFRMTLWNQYGWPLIYFSDPLKWVSFSFSFIGEAAGVAARNFYFPASFQFTSSFTFTFWKDS